ILRESMVLLDYLEDRFCEPPIAQRDPKRRAIERGLAALEGPFVAAGYRLILNQDRAKREALTAEMHAQYGTLGDYLTEHSPDGTYLFEDFGWAEVVYTSMFMRFWFLEYYEGFELPDDARSSRVKRWRDACVAHPSAQQVTREEIVKLYYDYAKGAGNGE